MTALVGTGAEYSVVRYRLAKELQKVLMPWSGPDISTAGGHLITPLSRCTAIIEIRGFAYVADFVVLPEYSKDVILEMVFLLETGAIINLPNYSVSFSTKQATDMQESEEREHVALRVTDDDTTTPQRCSMLVRVRCRGFDDSEGIADAYVELL